MNRILYACSSNPGKLREFARAALLWAHPSWRLQSLPALSHIPAPEETGDTFEANAVLKARYYSAHTDELVLADDSGLEVNALHGAPGIFSARFAGPQATDTENNRLLLSRLAQTADRSARFVCVLALARHGEILGTFEGAVAGEILHQPSPGNHGFGYDPLFFYPSSQRSFADLAPEEKLAVSHRGQALRRLFAFLPQEEIQT